MGTSDDLSADAALLGSLQASHGRERTEGFPMPDNVEAVGQSRMPLVNIAEGRALVRLNRPREHNRLEPDDLAVLRETFMRIDADSSVRVLVLTGTGKSFSSGFH